MTKPVLGVLKKSSFWSKANANTGNTTSSIAVKSAFPENKALEPKKIQSNPLSPFKVGVSKYTKVPIEKRDQF